MTRQMAATIDIVLVVQEVLDLKSFPLISKAKNTNEMEDKKEVEKVPLVPW